MSWLYSNTVTYNDYAFMDNNARELLSYLGQAGWSYNAICAAIGNIQMESGINPWSSGSGGYGLCGWTPTSYYKRWCSARGLDYSTGETQEYLLYTGEAHGWGGSHWGPSNDPHAPAKTPPLTWDEFKVSYLDTQTLAEYFMFYYEKPAYDPDVNKLWFRKQQAQYWYDTLGQSPDPPPVPPTPPTPPPKPPTPPKPGYHIIPPWLLFKFTNN